MGFRRKNGRIAKIRRTKGVAYGNNWDATSANLIISYGGRCSRCGTTGSMTNKLRMHHIIPVSRGGLTIPLNLKCLCDKCHALQPGHGHLRR